MIREEEDSYNKVKGNLYYHSKLYVGINEWLEESKRERTKKGLRRMDQLWSSTESRK